MRTALHSFKKIAMIEVNPRSFIQILLDWIAGDHPTRKFQALYEFTIYSANKVEAGQLVVAQGIKFIVTKRKPRIETDILGYTKCTFRVKSIQEMDEYDGINADNNPFYIHMY